MTPFHRLSLGVQFGILLAILIVIVLVAGSIVGQSIVVSQTINEARSVAQMVEHIGKWGSQYSGVHVRSAGLGTAGVGSYLERRQYAASSDDQAMLSGTRLQGASIDRKALERIDTYSSKNPALVQREISDIAAASSSPVKFRITARTVLNTNNAPTAFEREAIDAIDAAFATDASQVAGAKPGEYSKVRGGQLLYARAMMAAESCLRCHGSRDAAPAFLKTNVQFNGGGGFGYEAGKPAGIISVSVPLPAPQEALAASLTAAGWAALLAIAGMGALIFVFVARNVIAPVNRLRGFADALAGARLDQGFDVPGLGRDLRRRRSNNEVHRLAAAIAKLGASLKYTYAKMREARR